jgi:hypothetical protein
MVALYLVASNSDKDPFSGFKAVAAEELGKEIARSKAKKILVILDTCFSGEGAANIADAFARVMAMRMRMRVPGHQKAVAVIGPISGNCIRVVLRDNSFAQLLHTILFKRSFPQR